MGMWSLSSEELRGPRRSSSSRAGEAAGRTSAPQGLADGVLGLQGTVGNRVVQRMAGTGAARGGAGSRRGLPAGLRAGIERLSGVSMDDVGVHYNSDRPREVAAAAYTAHNDIHVAPGEERHLPHEAWHVVQQKRGRVAADGRIGGIAVNRDAGLEHEATRMGERASRLGAATPRDYGEVGPAARTGPAPAQPVRQMWGYWTRESTESRRLIQSPVLNALVGAGVELDDEKTVKVGKGFRRSMFVAEDRRMQQYRITDPTLQFYTAVTAARKEAVFRHGRALPVGANYSSKGDADFNSRGYLYFAHTPDLPRNFGLGPGEPLGKDFHIIRFTLPVDTLLQADPELADSGALRAAFAVPARLCTLYETPEIRSKEKRLRHEGTLWQP